MGGEDDRERPSCIEDRFALFGFAIARLLDPHEFEECCCTWDSGCEEVD
jgi:hypothetical protein